MIEKQVMATQNKGCLACSGSGWLWSEMQTKGGCRTLSAVITEEPPVVPGPHGGRIVPTFEASLMLHQPPQCERRRPGQGEEDPREEAHPRAAAREARVGSLTLALAGWQVGNSDDSTTSATKSPSSLFLKQQSEKFRRFQSHRPVLLKKILNQQ